MKGYSFIPRGWKGHLSFLIWLMSVCLRTWVWVCEWPKPIGNVKSIPSFNYQSTLKQSHQVPVILRSSQIPSSTPAEKTHPLIFGEFIWDFDWFVYDLHVNILFGLIDFAFSPDCQNTTWFVCDYYRGDNVAVSVGCTNIHGTVCSYCCRSSFPLTASPPGHALVCPWLWKWWLLVVALKELIYPNLHVLR